MIDFTLIAKADCDKQKSQNLNRYQLKSTLLKTYYESVTLYDQSVRICYVTRIILISDRDLFHYVFIILLTVSL